MFDLRNYSSTVADILETAEAGERLMPLAPTGPLHGEGLKRLRETAVGDLFDGAAVRGASFAEGVRSALFLYFSALDESHTISQGIGDSTGSFLHGVMHRQEPDAWNSKYWFRKVGRHELFPTLREEALRLPLRDGSLAAAIRSQSNWDPFWFIDECERCRGGVKALESDLLIIQRLEWQLLFDYCYRRALMG